MKATAIAHPNIALAKYWGKRPGSARLPAVPSLSVTLAGMQTKTTVEFSRALSSDELLLDGERKSGRELARVVELLDCVRAEAGLSSFARVESTNDFPTASGLASSASAFAALAVAARAAAGLKRDLPLESDLARRISISSARSIFGGYVELGLQPVASRLAASPVAEPDHIDLRVIVAVVREGAKDVSSTEGMLRTMASSPFYDAWVQAAPRIFERVRAAIVSRDVAALGAASEHSALAMHATMVAADPALVYWTGATVDALAAVRDARASGVVAYATIDAGPHVKVLTTSTHESRVAAIMGAVPGVKRVIAARPGEGARLEPRERGAP